MSDGFADSEPTIFPQAGKAAESPSATRYSLRSLFIVTMIICIVLAVLLSAMRSTREAAQRQACFNNLRHIGLALQNYHDVRSSFPHAITYAEDGTPMHSWRRFILRYTDYALQWPNYDYGEPWNGPSNRVTHDGCFPTLYRCPSAQASQNPMCTNYVMLIDDRPGKPNGPPNRPGSVPPSFDDKSAVIIIEIADSDIHWMEPRDVLLSELSMKINDRSKRSLSSYHGGACIAHADGSVEILDEATTEERLRELLAK